MGFTSISNSSAEMSPFLKWVGGKRWLASSRSTLFPSRYEHYYEPFLGSGAVYFSLNPAQATLSDINKELIECYSTIKVSWKEVEIALSVHHDLHCNEYYYQIRASKPKDPIVKAARFIYLNRTCWNGLYRVNMKGEFNVPIGTKKKAILDTDNFEKVANKLKNASLVSLDFEDVIDQANSGDFIFADPPYTVKHNFNGFVKYNEQFFHWSDQERLSQCLKRASKRGCLVMLTNANHPSIKELYENDFEITEVERTSVIAASSANRGVYQEIIIRNYKE
jgi:DNA adenine methylase